MKTIVTGVIAAVIGAGAGYLIATNVGGSGDVVVPKTADLSSDTAKINYMNAFQSVSSLKSQGLEVDRAAAYRGLEDALADEASAVTQPEAIEAIKRWSTEMREKDKAAQEAELKKNKEAGAAFIEKKKAEEGVVFLDSGLGYKVFTQGEGKKPTIDDVVKVHYHGTLIDGKVFDSSVDRGEPITYPIKGFVKGWQEGLVLMPVGSKYELYLPSDLAYGDEGSGPIGPGSTLVFQVELLGIEAADVTEKKDDK